MKRILIGLGVVLVLGVIVAASLVGRRGDPGVEVDLTEVERAAVTRWVKASGVIDPRVKVDLSAHVIGRIEELYVEEGDEIERGEPFLKLEQEAFLAVRDDWRARLSRAKTDVRKAQVDLDDARLKLRRMERLSGENIVSQERLEAAQLAVTSAELALDQARDAVEQARASLAKAEDDLEKTVIYAPLSGRVIELNAEEGEVVVSGTMNNPASVIGTIADLSELLAEVDVDETEIVYVEPGQTAELQVDAIPDAEYRGHVVEVGSSGFQKRAQQDAIFFKVKILLEDPDDRLRPGMSVRADVDTATHEDVPVVPIQAVVQRPPAEAETPEEASNLDSPVDPDEEIPVVFVMDSGQARQRPVETGISDATRVEIVDGVEAGERVISGPYRVLRDLEHGDAVHVDEEDEESEDG